MKISTSIPIIKIAALILFFLIGAWFFMVQMHYKTMKSQLSELTQIKEEYQNYVIALKKIIADYQKNNAEEIAAEKKKINERTDFLLLNRDEEYLRKSAVSYARKHNLQDAVERLYKSPADKTSSASKKRKQLFSRTRKQKKNHHMTSLNNNWWDAVKGEKIFSFPIDRNNFWISSRFGPRPKPDGSPGFHYGLDMAAVRGTPVRAAGEGIVIEAGYTAGYGNTVVIAHNRKFKTRYAHLEKITIRVGAKVDTSTIIGKVGDTGSIRKRGRDGSHLHFEVYVFGKQVNPLYFLA